MNLEKLTNENFMLFCATHYDNAHYASTEEFLEDLNRFKYIKKLLTRYIENDDLKERLILNHIIILNNCFGPQILNKLLYLKFKDQMHFIKPFLVFLNILQITIHNVDNDSLIYTDLIAMDAEIVNKLRTI